MEQEEKAGYYGPTYPTIGKYYSEEGVLLYEGDIRIEKIGNLSYPVVVWPDGKREAIKM